MMRLFVFVGVMLLGSACGGPSSTQGPALDGSSYSKACSQASDCLAVTLHPCGCACVEAAISQQAKVQWQNDKNTLVCQPVTCEANCIAPTVACESSLCVLRTP